MQKLSKIKLQMFLKYLIVALLSFLIDISLFTFCNSVLKWSIMIATILARVVSSFINYLLNKNKVFKNKNKTILTMTLYYILVILQMLVSGVMVTLIHSLIKINASIIKIPVELIIFVVNYNIQKYIIFKNEP